MGKIAENRNYKSAYIYLNEDYYHKPKEIFKYLTNFIILNTKENKKYSILDIGCAKGEFLYYLKSKAAFERMVGIDYSQLLIAEAKKFAGLKEVEFYCNLAESFTLNKKFDFITMTGVLSFFDDLRKPLNNLGRHLKGKGVAFITGLFNEDDIDVLVKYRNNKYNKEFESGWNNHSIQSVKKYLKNIGMVVKNIYKFELPFSLKKQTDPSRSWTIQTEYGKKFVNGLGLIYDLITLEVKHKD